jgi:hypothetical protein
MDVFRVMLSFFVHLLLGGLSVNYMKLCFLVLFNTINEIVLNRARIFSRKRRKRFCDTLQKQYNLLFHTGGWFMQCMTSRSKMVLLEVHPNIWRLLWTCLEIVLEDIAEEEYTVLLNNSVKVHKIFLHWQVDVRHTCFCNSFRRKYFINLWVW